MAANLRGTIKHLSPSMKKTANIERSNVNGLNMVVILKHPPKPWSQIMRRTVKATFSKGLSLSCRSQVQQKLRSPRRTDEPKKQRLHQHWWAMGCVRNTTNMEIGLTSVICPQSAFGTMISCYHQPLTLPMNKEKLVYLMKKSANSMAAPSETGIIEKWKAMKWMNVPFEVYP